jgi:dihydroorotate dehydrogenase electron transfer subunit
MGRYYAEAELARNKTLTSDLRIMSLVLHEQSSCKAGQYFMMWLPGHGEIPLSPSTCRSNYVEFVVEDVGPTSSALVSLEPGDRCFLRGPYGNPFSLGMEGPFLLIGGGTGAAPLLMAAQELADSGRPARVLIGARNSQRFCYAEEFQRLASVAAFTTEDGSLGRPGKVTDYVKEALSSDKTKVVLTAGPELMMKAIVSVSEKLGIYSEASLVRIIKCADGVCGSCVLDPNGQLVCKDGPVISGSVLAASDFGSKTRDKFGRRVELG